MRASLSPAARSLSFKMQNGKIKHALIRKAAIIENSYGPYTLTRYPYCGAAHCGIAIIEKVSQRGVW